MDRVWRLLLFPYFLRSCTANDPCWSGVSALIVGGRWEKSKSARATKAENGLWMWNNGEQADGEQGNAVWEEWIAKC